MLIDQEKLTQDSAVQNISHLLSLSERCGENVEGSLKAPVLQYFQVTPDDGLENVRNNVLFAILQELFFLKVRVHLAYFSESFREFCSGED